jgi:hypothetical protein
VATPSQTITITTTPQPPRGRKLFVIVALLILLFPLVWYIAVPEWDYYASYSGVIVEKGMDCGLCLFGGSTGVELYIVLQDEHGKPSKRYVGSSNLLRRSQRWMDLAVGTFVVKEKGYSAFPHLPGATVAPPQPASAGTGWIIFGVILFGGTLMFVKLRQIWKLLESR